jgi:hypothetical protein
VTGASSRGGRAVPPALHIPDEPVGRRDRWYAAVLAGAPLHEVVEGADGVAEWLFVRWRVLATVGLDAKDFATLVGGYRREIWLWLGGERTWAQCCSGLAGRVSRRLGG